MTPGEITFEVIRNADHPQFAAAYQALYDYFGGRGEMESIETIRARLDWEIATPVVGYAMCYEIVVALAADGSLAAVRDHSVIFDVEGVRNRGEPVTVHLSHIFIAPRFRGRFLIAKLERFPREAANAAVAAFELGADVSVVLAAEVEPYLDGDIERINRLKLFKALGYVPADPQTVPYFQPDFREPDVIESTGGPLPLQLILMLWRIGREHERTIPVEQLLSVVRSLYAMYGRSMWPAHMQAVSRSLAGYPPARSLVSLDWGQVHPDFATPPG